MPLEQALIALMLDEVTIEIVSLDGDGKPVKDKYNEFVYDGAEEVQCQVYRTSERVIDRSGREVTTTARIIFADPELLITEDTLITLPDGTKPAIIGINQAKDDVGPYLLEVLV